MTTGGLNVSFCSVVIIFLVQMSPATVTHRLGSAGLCCRNSVTCRRHVRAAAAGPVCPEVCACCLRRGPGGFLPPSPTVRCRPASSTGRALPAQRPTWADCNSTAPRFVSLLLVSIRLIPLETLASFVTGRTQSSIFHMLHFHFPACLLICNGV